MYSSQLWVHYLIGGFFFFFFETNGVYSNMQNKQHSNQGPSVPEKQEKATKLKEKPQ
jgi:hypothetical protein